MGLAIGDAAPHFTLNDQHGKVFDSKDHIGKKPLVLFYVGWSVPMWELVLYFHFLVWKRRRCKPKFLRNIRLLDEASRITFGFLVSEIISTSSSEVGFDGLSSVVSASALAFMWLKPLKQEVS